MSLKKDNKHQTTFDLTAYEYNDILNELRPLIDRYFVRYGINVSVTGIKLTNRSNNIAAILALTNKKTLWSFKYSFLNPENWEAHQLQSSAKPIEIVELTHLRSNFIEFQGMTESEADEACLKFFIDASTCLHKEEHEKRLKSKHK